MILKNKHTKLILSTLLAITTMFSVAGIASALTAKEPNLVALPAEDVRLVVEGETSTLRFSTLSWNNGAGPVEIYGGDIIGGDKQKVIQNIYNDDGSITEHQAGDFVYHEDHSHIHFEGYATYTFQSVDAPGGSERYGQKTSFCLMDTDRINHKLDGASKRSVYNTCSGAVQGISVGWGDKYGYQLAGQKIDLTGLSDGDYTLIVEINPLGHLVESNYADNISEVIVRLENGTASIVQDDEPTDPIAPAPSTKFSIGDNVKTQGVLNVRDNPDGNLLGQQSRNTRGIVVGGPVYAAGYWWWEIDYENEIDGWSVEKWLRKLK